MDNVRIIKKITSHLELKKIDNLSRLMFKDEFREKEFNTWQVVWDQGNFILDDIVGQDFSNFYDLMSNRTSLDSLVDTPDKERGPGWIEGEGFIPDKMRDIIMHSEESPEKILNELRRLFNILN